MGYWYLRPLKSDWSVDEATTNRFDLPSKGHLSGLYIRLNVTNAAVLKDMENVWPFQRTDIRIIGNGNKEIIDLRGRQLQALNFWETGEMPKDNLHAHSGGATEQYVFIPFGRYMGDPDYGLILENFKAGVQFEETNTFSTTYYTDATELYTIHGLFRKDPEPGMFSKGFFKKKQILNKDTASATEYDVKLPTENKLKQIHLFSEPDLSSNVCVTGWFTNLDKIFLSIKSKEEYILDNVDSGFFARMIHQLYKRRAHNQIVAYGGLGGDYWDTMIYERESSHFSEVGTMGIGAMLEYTDSWLERTAHVYGYDLAGADKTLRFYLDSWGIGYHGDIPILLIDPMAEEEEYLDTKENADVTVGFTEGASTGNIYVVLDELQKTYPA